MLRIENVIVTDSTAGDVALVQVRVLVETAQFMRAFKREQCWE